MTAKDLEKIRKENILRNKNLLKSLNLDVLSESVLSKEKQKRSRILKATSPKVTKRRVDVPQRRSRRLANDPEEKELQKKQEEEFEEFRLREERVRQLRQSKLVGDFDLIDLLIDKSLGYLKNETQILNIDGNPAIENKAHEPELDDMIFEEEGLLNRLLEVGNRISKPSAEDSEPESSRNNDSLKRKREDFEKLTLNKHIDPSKIKLTNHRITSLHFHSSIKDRIISAGDTNGSLGLWIVDQSSEDDDPILITLKPHGKTISRIAEVPHSPGQIVSSSYDGSLRLNDLVKQKSSDVLGLFNTYDEPLGVSDLRIHPQSPQIFVLSTLEGHLLLFDSRAPKSLVRYLQLLRLHDKKIGGFCSNPNRDYQIASASLDRTFRLWDLRATSCKKSHSEIPDGLSSPNLYGEFNSRLSVSNVDWNSNNRLICNGYDDKLNFFNLSGDEDKHNNINDWKSSYAMSTKQDSADLRVSKSIIHNCQTGRWVSILKARWHVNPIDGCQKALIANMNRSFDIYCQSGEFIANLLAPEMTAVPAVATFHPTQDWLIGGTSSGKVYLFD